MKIWLLILIPLLTPTLFAGHGLCNNSAGFRLVKHYVSTTEGDIYQNLALRLDSGEDLIDNQIVHFQQFYTQLMQEGAESILEASIPQRLAENGFSHPSQYARNNALTMDYVMSFGVEPDYALEQLLVERDRAINPTELVENGIYAGDLRTGGELMRSGARALRWNGAEVPPAVRDYFASALGGQSLDRSSLIELRQQMHDLLPSEDLHQLEHTETIGNAYEHLAAMEIGDTALVSFNAQIRLEDQTVTAPRRYTIFLQKFTGERMTMYDPMPGQVTSQDLNYILTLSLDGGVEAFSNRLKQFQEALFRGFGNQLGDAINSGSDEEQYLARLLMRDVYGIDSVNPPAEIIFEDFCTITHKPPPA